MNEAMLLIEPGKCAVCNASPADSPGAPERKFFDTGTYVEFWGVIYLCEPCITAHAAVICYRSPADISEISTLEGVINGLEDRIKELEKYEHIVTGISAAGVSLSDILDRMDDPDSDSGGSGKQKDVKFAVSGGSTGTAKAKL